MTAPSTRHPRPLRLDMGPSHPPSVADQIDGLIDVSSLVEPAVLRTLHQRLLEHQLAAGGCRVCRALRSRCALHLRQAVAVPERPRLMPSPVRGWLTAGNVADLCRVRRATVRGWAKSGRIDGQRTPAGRWLFHPDQVTDFLRAMWARETSR